MPFVNGSEPLEDCADPQAVEPSFAKLALIDLNAGNGVTVTLVREAAELAIAAIGARQLTSSRPLNSQAATESCYRPRLIIVKTDKQSAEEFTSEVRLCDVPAPIRAGTRAVGYFRS